MKTPCPGRHTWIWKGVGNGQHIGCAVCGTVMGGTERRYGKILGWEFWQSKRHRHIFVDDTRPIKKCLKCGKLGYSGWRLRFWKEV